MVSPALTLATLGETFLMGLGPPLQIRSEDWTLVMGWGEVRMSYSDSCMGEVEDLHRRIQEDEGSPISSALRH